MRVTAVLTREEQEVELGFESEELFEIVRVAAGVTDAGKTSRGDQLADSRDLDGRGELRKVVEQDRDAVRHLISELPIKLEQVLLVVTKEVGRHQEQAAGVGGDRFRSQFHRTVECRVGDTRDDRDAAPLDRQMHQPDTIREPDVEKLAGLTKQADASGSIAAEEVHQFEHRCVIRLMPVPAVRRNRRGINAWFHAMCSV